jgi:hypothetical protein
LRRQPYRFPFLLAVKSRSDVKKAKTVLIVYFVKLLAK